MNKKIAIVTGGSSGVGLGIAKKLVAKDIFTIIVSRSNEKLKKAKLEISKINQDNIYSISADISDSSQVSRMIQEIIEKFGTIDYLVMSAGVSIHGSFNDLLERDWEEVININLKGVFITAKAVWPIMLKKTNCQIINISSASGLTPYPTGSIYCASKAGVNSLMDVLALEGQEVGIKVTNICPGQIDSAIWNPEDEDVNKARKDMLNPESIGDLVYYILSRPHNEHFRNIVIHPFAIQPFLRGRNRGPGGNFPKNLNKIKLDSTKKFRI